MVDPDLTTRAIVLKERATNRMAFPENLDEALRQEWTDIYEVARGFLKAADESEIVRENDRLRSLCRKQQAQIESLNGFADAVETLREIGNVIGCGHIDSADERRQLVNCAEQVFAAKNRMLGTAGEYLQKMAGMLKDHPSKIAEKATEFVAGNLINYTHENWGYLEGDCPSCGGTGTGYTDDDQEMTCSDCRGSGFLPDRVIDSE